MVNVSFHAATEFPKGTEEVVARRCEFAFDRFSRAIRDVQVTLRDENGPRGKDDVHCLIQIAFERLEPVIIHRRAQSLGAAVSEAVDRAAFQIGRRLRRKGDTRRRAAAIR